MEEHLIDAMRENAHFLMEDCGLTLEQTAVRLGVKKESLQKSLDREKKENT